MPRPVGTSLLIGAGIVTAHKNKTALEAGIWPGIGYAKTCGNFGDEEVPGAKRTEGNFGQQHREMSNMPCYNCRFGKAESDGTL